MNAYSTEEILRDRERRFRAVAAAAAGGCAATVRAVIPGGDKNIPEAFLLVRRFAAVLRAETGRDPVLLRGPDGPWALFAPVSPELKKTAVQTEETHPAGRFADIDVYDANGTLSRGYARSCFLCGRPAFVCARNGTHSVTELLSFLRAGTRAALEGEISDCFLSAALAELDLEDKFGLVCPSSSGAHGDMDYALMKRAAETIAPYLSGMFFAGAEEDSPAAVRERTRAAGLEAERAMYAVSGGVNAYKGLIFCCGTLLAAAGRAFSRPSGDPYGEAAEICRCILGEFALYPDTFGAEAHRRHGWTGARGEARGGFPSVREAARELSGDLSPASLLRVLARIVSRTEDTVLLKRAGSLERYRAFSDMMAGTDTSDPAQLRKTTAECVKNGISPGGSADVLAAAAMMEGLSRLFVYGAFGTPEETGSGDGRRA